MLNKLRYFGRATPKENLNQRPIIGIVTQDWKTDPNKAYIMASYIKYVEQFGARVVPILHTSTDEEVLNIVRQVNGILLPGGSMELMTGNFLIIFTKVKIIIYLYRWWLLIQIFANRQIDSRWS